jgi:hypothetical protein
VNSDPPITSQSPSFHSSNGLGTGYVVASLLISWIIVFCSGGIVFGQEDVAREALSQKKYPWYNAQSDQLERIEMNERPQIRSKNRNTIPLKPVKNAKPKKNWNWGNPGSFLGGLSVFAWFLIGILIAAIAGVLFWAFLRMETNQPKDDESARRRSMAESIKQLPFDLDSESGDFRKAAHNEFLAGDYRKAMIYLFSHVLVSLDQKGHIRLRKGKTNRQYLLELRPYRSLANFYQRVMVPFEATFFGDHDLEKQDFESCWNKLEDFQKDVDQTSQVAHG